MSLLIRTVRIVPRLAPILCHNRPLSNSGSDIPAGSIRAGGGKFGEIEQAEENVYFKKLEQEQLRKLKEMKQESADHIEGELGELELRVKKLKRRLKEHQDDMTDIDKA